MNKLVKLFLVLFLPFVCQSQILFQSSFEMPNPFSGWTNNQSCCSHSVTSSSEHPHNGNQSFRAEVKTNDPAISSGFRAELTLPNIDDDGDMWYGFSIYFQANNAANNDWTGCCGHVIQWHPASSSGGAVLDLRADGGKFDFCVNAAGGGSTIHQPGILKDIVPGRWYDIVMHVNWANPGLLEVWIDGTLYYTRQVNWTTDRYLKFGMNRWNMTNTWVVFYDNIKIGRNVGYAAVNPTNILTPVSLVYFKYIEMSDILQWETASEDNNDRFEILKSSDGVNWNQIGSVPSKAYQGNSSSSLIYQFAL